MPTNLRPVGSGFITEANGAKIADLADKITYVSVNTGSDSNNGRSRGTALATLDAALDRAHSNGGGRIFLSGGTHVAPTITVPDDTHFEGIGKGLTIVQRPASASNSVFINDDGVDGNHNLSWRKMSIDGNKAAAGGTPDATSWYGLFLRACGTVDFEDVEFYGCLRKGLMMDGLTLGDTARYVWLDGVAAHHNADVGIHIGNGTRGVHYDGVTVYENQGVGILLDASEAQSSNIYAFGNDGHGIYINNLFDTQWNGLKANQNGKSGIFVLGLTNSIGSSWQALDNGRLEAGWADVWFDPSNLGYGKTKRLTVTGIKAGQTTNSNYKGAYATTAGHQANRAQVGGVDVATDYAVYVSDDLNAEQVNLVDVDTNPCLVGRIRKPVQSPWHIRESGAWSIVMDEAHNVDIGNTATETTICAVGLAAGGVRVGDVYEFDFYATLDYVATSGSMDLRIRSNPAGQILGDMNIGSQTTSSAGTGGSRHMAINIKCECIAIDSSSIATWQVTGMGTIDFSATLARAFDGSGTRGINNTGDMLALTWQWGTANAGNVLHVKRAVASKRK